MRRSVVLLALPVAWIACFSASSSGPPDVSFDASFDATEFDGFDFDAEPEAAPGEASPPVDAPMEASPAEAGPSPAVVTVIGASGPEPGIPIVWGDATGAAVSQATTDAHGSAAASDAGGMVTALLGTPAQPALYTIVGVQDGDSLVILDRTSLAALPGWPTVSVSFDGIPASPPSGGSPSFIVGDCTGTGTPPVIVPVVETCIGLGQFGTSVGAAFPALVEENDPNGDLLAFAFSKSNGFMAPDDAGAFDVSLGGSTWNASPGMQQVTGIDLPEGAVTNTWTNYEEVADGVRSTLSARPPPADAGQAPPGSVYVATHPGYPDFVQTEAGYSLPGAGFAQGALAVATRMAPPKTSGTIAVDFGPLDTLPAIVGSSVQTGSDAGLAATPARPAITWTTAAGTLGSSTGVLALASWSGSGQDGSLQFGTWTIVSPGTAQTSLQAPELPAQLGAWAPVDGASFLVSSVYAVQGGSALPTYAAIRAAASLFELQTSCLGYPLAPPLPVAGTMAVSAFTSGGCG